MTAQRALPSKPVSRPSITSPTGSRFIPKSASSSPSTACRAAQRGAVIVRQGAEVLQALYHEAERVPDGFAYRSDTNDEWLDVPEIEALLAQLPSS